MFDFRYISVFLKPIFAFGAKISQDSAGSHKHVVKYVRLVLQLNIFKRFVMPKNLMYGKVKVEFVDGQL